MAIEYIAFKTKYTYSDSIGEIETDKLNKFKCSNFKNQHSLYTGYHLKLISNYGGNDGTISYELGAYNNSEKNYIVNPAFRVDNLTNINFEIHKIYRELKFGDYKENPIVDGYQEAKRRTKTEITLQDGSVRSYYVGIKRVWVLPFLGITEELKSEIEWFFDLDSSFLFYPRGLFYSSEYYEVEWVNDFEFTPNSARYYIGNIQLREI